VFGLGVGYRFQGLEYLYHSNACITRRSVSLEYLYHLNYPHYYRRFESTAGFASPASVCCRDVLGVCVCVRACVRACVFACASAHASLHTQSEFTSTYSCVRP
jgi:hypothetical protein